jgi:tetratricopeptide (TPR) repeat protein
MTDAIPAILVLGAPRTGTSAVAGMLAAAGAAVPGPMVRNWDNAHGHFEATAAVRLSDAVLARSGGSWLQAPGELRWTADEAQERDRLLAPSDGRPALIKDPRVLLCWPFWSATERPLAVIGTVRHPLAAARSQLAWRRLPLDEALRLWLAHVRPLLQLTETTGLPLIDIDAEPARVLAAAQDAARRLWPGLDPEAMPAAFDPAQLHHDAEAGAMPQDTALLAEAEAVHRALLSHCPVAPRRAPAGYPWPALERIEQALAAGRNAGLAEEIAAAARAVADPAAVLVPACAALLRAHQPEVMLAALAAAPPCAPALAGLLLGKALLAAGRAQPAVAALRSACAAADPYWEARSLLAHALHAARKRDEARAQLIAIAPDAVHPAQCWATAAEWAWADGDHTAALDLFVRGLDSAPTHRRGRLRCRQAELLLTLGRRTEAIATLHTALGEDPTYPRARELLATPGFTGS